MRSLGPAGWSDRGFFGLTAKTFGNPMGASRGGGAWTDATTDPLPPNARRDAGNNINGPNQGGGGRAGHAWIARTIATTATTFASNVCAGGGAAVLVDGNGEFWRSTDGGITWTNIGVTFAGAAITIGYSDGVFIAINGAGTGRRSIDGGLTWAATGATHSSGPPTLASDGAGSWIAAITNSTVFQRSISANNGTTWTQEGSQGSGTFIPSAIYDGTQYITTGVAQPSGDSVIATLPTPAGVWTFTTIAPTTELFGATLTFQEGIYTVPVSNGTVNLVRNASTVAALATAADVAVGLSGSGLQCLLAGNGLWWAFDAHGNVAGSTDAVHWAQGTLNFIGSDFPGKVFQAYDAVNHSFIAIGSTGLSVSTHSDAEL